MIAALFSWLPVWVALVFGPHHAIDEDPGTPSGPYRASLLRALATWPAARLPLPEKNDAVLITAYALPDRPHAIGLGQSMVIGAPLASVRRLLESFDRYGDLYFTFKRVQIVARDGNRVEVEWEESIPLPFVSNIRYVEYFWVDDERPERVIYRYQLKSSAQMRYFDGLVVAERIDDHATRYTEWDFYDANWGAIETLAGGSIWPDSLRDAVLCDRSVKLTAEHPDWNTARIRREAKSAFHAEAYRDALAKRRAFSVP